MEGEVLKICALAILCGIVGAILGRAVGGMSAAIKIAGLMAVFGGVLGLLGTAVDFVNALGLDEVAAEYSSLMLRGLGIAVLCRICSDVCRDCGESTVSLAVESAGKLGMIILALPAVTDIISLAEELLDKM